MTQRHAGALSSVARRSEPIGIWLAYLTLACCACERRAGVPRLAGSQAPRAHEVASGFRLGTQPPSAATKRTNSMAQDGSPLLARSAPLFHVVPSPDALEDRALRGALFVPAPEHLGQASLAEEITRALVETKQFLGRILRPDIYEAFAAAEWFGFRKGVAPDFEEHCIYAGANTPAGVVQVLGFERRVIVRTHLLVPSSTSNPSAALRSALVTTDRLFQLETHKGEEGWHVGSSRGFLTASSAQDYRVVGWKALEVWTDGQGVFFLVRKIPEGLAQFKSDRLRNAPDPNWFSPPPDGSTRSAAP